MATWKDNIITTSLDWRQGKTYHARPQDKALHLYYAKPRTKGSARFEGEVKAEVDTSTYIYSVMKTDRGKVAIKRTLRKGKRAKRARKPRTSTTTTTRAKRTTPRKAPAKRTTPRKAPAKKTRAGYRQGAYSEDIRQMMFPWWPRG